MSDELTLAPDSKAESAPARFFVHRSSDRKTYGPVSAAEMTEWIRLGRVVLRDNICRQGQSTWFPVERTTDFAKHVLGVADEPPEAAGVYLRRSLRLLAQIGDRLQRLCENKLNERIRKFSGDLIDGFVYQHQDQMKKQEELHDLGVAELEYLKAVAIAPEGDLSRVEADFNGTSIEATLCHHRGQIEEIYGSEKDAEVHYRRALALQESPRVHFILGQISESRREFTRAIHHYERCLRLEPEGIVSTDLLLKVSRLRQKL